MFNAGADYVDRLQLRKYKSAFKMEVWSDTNLYQGTITGIQPGGDCDTDETRPIRRTTSFVIEIGKSNIDLIPKNPTDLLHPLSGNVLKPFRGPIGSNGLPIWVPLGVYGLTKPQTNDNPADLNIALTCNDLSAGFTARGYLAPYSIASGTNAGQALHDLLEFIWPGGVYNFAPTDVALPATTFGTDLSSPTDPWADAQGIALAMSMELFMDVIGTRTTRPISDPLTDPIVATYAEGPGSRLLTTNMLLDETQTYNVVQVIGNGTGGPAVTGAAVDGDPNSPTYWLGPFGKRPLNIISPLFPFPGQSNTAAVAQGNSIAAAQFHMVCRALNTPGWTMIPDPTLWEGDCIQLDREVIGANDEYAASAITYPFDADADMTVTARPRRLVSSPS